MSRSVALFHDSVERPHLTGPQAAAVARLVYAVGQPGAVALLCGPAGVGKTTVLRAVAADGLPRSQIVRSVSWPDMRCDRGDRTGIRGEPVVGSEGSFPHVLLVDDAHRATTHGLAEVVEQWQRRREGIAIVLAGEGRLLTLVAGDARLEQSVRLRATLPPFTLAESRRLLAAVAPLASAGESAGEDAGEVIRTIHEIAGGVPAIAIRLAEMAALLADAEPRRRLNPDDIETIHRRLCLNAA